MEIDPKNREARVLAKEAASGQKEEDLRPLSASFGAFTVLQSLFSG